jgi:hypothetical protein
MVLDICSRVTMIEGGLVSSPNDAPGSPSVHQRTRYLGKHVRDVFHDNSEPETLALLQSIRDALADNCGDRPMEHSLSRRTRPVSIALG